MSTKETSQCNQRVTHVSSSKVFIIMLLKILICHAVDLTTLYIYPDKFMNIEMNYTFF